jgi:hypothetical protein
MARTVPPARLARRTPAATLIGALRESAPVSVAHGVGRSIGHCAQRRFAVVVAPRVEPGAHGTRGRAKSATSTHAHGARLCPGINFRDRARQDVAPGAAMDGFTAFPEIDSRAKPRAVFMRSCSILRMARACQ